MSCRSDYKTCLAWALDQTPWFWPMALPRLSFCILLFLPCDKFLLPTTGEVLKNGNHLWLLPVWKVEIYRVPDLSFPPSHTHWFRRHFWAFWHVFAGNIYLLLYSLRLCGRNASPASTLVFFNLITIFFPSLCGTGCQFGPSRYSYSE